MASGFAPYREFVGKLRSLMNQDIGRAKDWQSECRSALNGGAGEELARLVPADQRREFGTFFTGSSLAKKLVTRIPDLSKRSRIVDPTLGAGDLLLAAARRLSRGSTVGQTLENWERCFAGLDREGIFVEAARLRLWLLAHVLHGVKTPSLPGPNCLHSLQKGNLLARPDVLSRAKDVVLNPPFSRILAPHWYALSEGRVNAAAVITHFIVTHISAGVRIHALLPEVLRSGSCYETWRKNIARECDVRDIESCGLFDSADVDVFMVTLEKRKKNKPSHGSWTQSQVAAATTLGDHFEVHVGQVVDYRDPCEGRIYAYATPQSVARWKEVNRINKHRAFQGTLVSPPFVVLRRTSRPGDTYRAVPSIILGKRPVAVENHFIVCRPLRGGTQACRSLLRALKHPGVNQFLNCDMRCRHLTVSVVKRIPLLNWPIRATHQ